MIDPLTQTTPCYSVTLVTTLQFGAACRGFRRFKKIPNCFCGGGYFWKISGKAIFHLPYYICIVNYKLKNICQIFALK